MSTNSVDPDHVKAEPHPDVGAVIQRDVGPIIERWSRRAIEEQPNATGLHRAALQNHLPLLLWEIGRSLIETDPTRDQHHQLPALQHGEQRWEAGWSLEELIRDYQILRLVLLDYLEEALTRSLTSREVMAIGLLLDESIRSSVSMYMQSPSALVEEGQENERENRADASNRHVRKSISDFLALLAHEARNFLAPVRQAIEVLDRAAGEDTTVRWAVELMERQIRQLSRLVDDLLDVARLGKGGLSLRRERTNLAMLLRGTAEGLRQGFEERNVRFDVQMPTVEVLADVDPIRIAQVLTNLLHNAQKFTPPGGAVVVRGDLEPERRRFRVRVQDDGVGIDSGSLHAIFESYQRSADERVVGQGGLGLGLALVKGLVECHGGAITAASDGPGRGATFDWWIPIIQSLPEEERAEAKSLGIGPMRILIIEDNADAAESLGILLTTVGHTIRTAASGEEGLQAAIEWRPDAVLCDMGLPGLSGDGLAPLLRNAPGLERTRLIALSGYGGQEHRRRALDAGFHQYLVKPIDLAQLEACLAAERAPATSDSASAE